MADTGRGHFIDLTGQRFGRLLVVCRWRQNFHGGAAWLCECDCGNSKPIYGASLRGGLTRSCGCLRREELKARPGDRRGRLTRCDP